MVFRGTPTQRTPRAGEAADSTEPAPGDQLHMVTCLARRNNNSTVKTNNK